MHATIFANGLAVAFLVLGVSAGTAAASGDVEKGERVFKKCTACHSLDEGKKKIGPSLHQVMGRKAGSESYFNYSDSYTEAGEKGLIWSPENLIAYLEDPKAFLREYLDDKKAKSKMVMKFKKLSDREDVAAYLESLQKAEE